MEQPETAVAPQKAPTRASDGKFKKLSVAEKARRLQHRNPKMTNSQIAKKLGVRPQVIYRALHRDKGRPRVYITKEFRTSQVERLAKGEVATCDEICQVSASKTCECTCGGLNHGIQIMVDHGTLVPGVDFDVRTGGEVVANQPPGSTGGESTGG